MWIFEITKTTSPYSKRFSPHFDSSTPHIRTQRLVLWNKAKPMLLTYREERKQPRHPIAGLPAAWVLSSAGKLIRYLHGSYFLPCHNTLSTPDASGATKYYRTHYNQWYCLHWMGHGKSPTVNCCCVLLMTFWQCQMIFNGRFVASSVDRLKLLQTLCKPSFVPQTISSCFFYPPFYLSVVARLMSVMCIEHSFSPGDRILSRHAPYCWLDPSLFWYWPRLSFLKRFGKNTYPTFKVLHSFQKKIKNTDPKLLNVSVIG